VTFRLGTSTTGQDDRGPTKKDTQFAIYGQSGKEIGHIYVNEGWRSGDIIGEHEFVLLCEGRDKRAEDGRDPDDEVGW
jgi:hypothetical protein